MTKLLLVDDDDALREILARLLRNTGHHVTEAASGAEALRAAAAESFELLILDVMMPEMDGYHLTRKFRELPATHTIPILLLTVNVLGPDPDLAQLSGADGVDVKTVNIGRLNQKIKETLAARPASPAP